MENKATLNVIPLVYYDIIIGMDLLENHIVIINCLEKTFACEGDERKAKVAKSIPRLVTIRQIITM